MIEMRGGRAGLPERRCITILSIGAYISVRRTGLSDQLQYQVRIYFTDAFAEVARSDPGNPLLNPLSNVLERHDATAVCQFDAFADYVAEAERQGIGKFPLYRWTKATIEDPEKKAKHIRSFALHVGGSEIYSKGIADALEADLQPLIGGPLITRLSRHDTNPANNPQMPAEYRS